MLGELLKIVLNNFYYKLTAVGLAFVFWYFVQGEELLEIHRKVRVEFVAPKGYAIQGGNVRFRDTTLVGPRALLGNFSARPLEAQIQLSARSPGPLRFRISRDRLSGLDNRVKLTIHDPFLTVFMDEQLTKRVAVKEYLQGIPAEGYIVEKTVITPSYVVVTGLKSELKKLNFVMTEPIDIAGIQRTRQFETSLQANGLQASVSTNKINVNLQVGEKSVNARFDNIPIEFGEKKGYHVRIRPISVSIVVQGTSGVLNFLTHEDFSAFVDVSELDVGTHESRIQVKIPKDTVLIETVPEIVSIKLQLQ